MARVTFDSIFIQHPDGSLEPRQRIRVGGVTFGPGVRFTRGVAFAGIDFTQFIGHDLEVETDTQNDILVITGIY
jgi:hypothetical protein